jgi:hypothetical protein
VREAGNFGIRSLAKKCEAGAAKVPRTNNVELAAGEFHSLVRKK